tara:strand:+ start:99 stop:1928 length:1830 start_codon:yes stop_codon:yes gene_type:complete
LTKIIGISAFYHDSAISLIENGEIISAVQEERFTRIKHDPSFPKQSIKYILNKYDITIDDIDYIVFYDKPFLKFERLTETYLANIPKGFLSFRKAMPIWLKDKLFLKTMLIKEFKKFSNSFDKSKLLFNEHHFSHASSAFYPSPYEKSLILTLDGVGEWATSTVAIGEKNNIQILKEINFPHSLGLLYSAFTYYTGFKVNSGEYKLMGLAPYGNPIYYEIIKNYLIDIKNDGSFRLNQKYFNYMTGLTMINSRFEKLFNKKIRKPEEIIEQFHMDIAASIQKIIEEVILLITSNLYEEYKIDNLCLAGGVALNCVANGKILEQNKFKNIWIQPASGDSGGAIGAALAAWYKYLKNKRIINNNDSMHGSYLGPSYTEEEIQDTLDKIGASYQKFSFKKIVEKTSIDLSNGKAVGWFQGRMEFGPRALGARSILADPRSTTMQKNLNLKIKFRESFRPFAPAIKFDKLNEWFNLNVKSPYMLLVSKVLSKHLLNIKNNQNIKGVDKINIVRSLIPAVTHVDNSARIQTVHKETNQLFYNLLDAFEKITNVPILVNTSFNVRGEPIVCSPEDAFRCFMGTGIDVLVIENFYLKKEEQNTNLIANYKNKYDLD